MKSHLPLGIDELLGGAVETARLELKESWDPKTTGAQVLKTLCAFANDLQNLNGGYLVIGVAESSGVAVRPVVGLSDNKIDEAQKWIRGNCNHIEPVYMPVMDVVEVDGKRVLVLWAPASDARPHQAPDGPKEGKKYWIRVGSESIVAKENLLTELIAQTAKIPFDDRRAYDAINEDLSFSIVRELLRDVGSDLLEEPDADRVYRAMRVVTKVNSHTAPRNIALLFFSNEPHRWFPGARIEVVEFRGDAPGDVLAEKDFRGPLHQQVRQCLAYLETLTVRHLEKEATSIETRGWVSFPVPALREAVVNAVYHRSYEESEPTKVYLFPNRIEVISYPGPVHGIEPQHLAGSAQPPPVPARNRRIGEFLKELRLAESRGTGVLKIRRSLQANGSPPPAFDFNDARSYFRVTLPAHPEYVALAVLRDYAYQKATGSLEQASATLGRAWHDGIRTPSLAVALVRDHVEQRDLGAADQLVDDILDVDISEYARAIMLLASAHAEQKNFARSHELLDKLPDLLMAQDAIEAAILERRMKRPDRAHRLFESAGAFVLKDVRALHEYAQTKLDLSKPLRNSKQQSDREARQRLLQDAVGQLERVVQLDAPPVRRAWAWFDLGNARKWLGAPSDQVNAAYERAVELAPREDRFRAALKRK